MRPDPNGPLSGAFRCLIRIKNWHLRHCALFNWGSKVNSQFMPPAHHHHHHPPTSPLPPLFIKSSQVTNFQIGTNNCAMQSPSLSKTAYFFNFVVDFAPHSHRPQLEFGFFYFNINFQFMRKIVLASSFETRYSQPFPNPKGQGAVPRRF